VIVSAQKAGIEARATVADANGRFVVAFLDPANSPYDVVFTALAGHAVVAAVPVSSTAARNCRVSTRPSRCRSRPSAASAARSGRRGRAARRRCAAAGGRLGGRARGRTSQRQRRHRRLLAEPADRPAAACRLLDRLPLSFSGAGTAGRYLLDVTADGYLPRQDTIDLASSSFTWNVTLSRQ